MWLCVEVSDKLLMEMSVLCSVLSFPKCKLILLCPGENFLFFIYLISFKKKLSEWKIMAKKGAGCTGGCGGRPSKEKQMEMRYENQLNVVLKHVSDLLCL